MGLLFYGLGFIDSKFLSSVFTYFVELLYFFYGIPLNFLLPMRYFYHGIPYPLNIVAIRFDNKNNNGNEEYPKTY
jgi:hypothetical protein